MPNLPFSDLPAPVAASLPPDSPTKELDSILQDLMCLGEGVSTSACPTVIEIAVDLFSWWSIFSIKCYFCMFKNNSQGLLMKMVESGGCKVKEIFQTWAKLTRFNNRGQHCTNLNTAQPQIIEFENRNIVKHWPLKNKCISCAAKTIECWFVSPFRIQRLQQPHRHLHKSSLWEGKQKAGSRRTRRAAAATAAQQVQIRRPQPQARKQIL